MKVLKQTTLAAATSLLLAQTAGAVTTTRVIVEFEGDPAAVEMARAENSGQVLSDDQIENYRAQLAFEQDAIFNDMRAAGIDFTIANVNIPDYTGLPAGNVEYRYTMVLNGAAMDLPIGQIGALWDIPGVKKVHRAEIHQPLLDNSVRYINAPAMYGADHALTQFDGLLEGFEGQGINMSVLDTGVEHHHEMFGGDATPPRLALAPHSAAVPTNDKVIYSMPTSDPFLEDGFGHGTHVATTALGYLGYTLEGTPVHGVAPQAKLMTYGVCQNSLSTASVGLGAAGVGNPLGGCRGETILLGLEDSVSRRTVTGFPKPVAHVLNMSLGSPSGTPNSATAVAASNAALTGTIVVAAAGNSGNNRGVVGAPSTGTHVISVAASTDPGEANLKVELEGGESFAVELMSGTPRPAGSGLTAEYAYVADSTTATSFPPEVAGRIALVNSHSGAFATGIANAEAAGAIGYLLKRDDGANGVAGGIPAASVKTSDFAVLVDHLNGGATAGAIGTEEITFGGDFQMGDITGFSSRGPVAGFAQVKPDVSAPGQNILAGLPPGSVLGALEATAFGPSYGDISGTSMASPHVAGAAALIKQANPSWGPAEVRTALINTSTNMRDADGNPNGYGNHNPTVNSQGGGLVDVEAAAFAQALMGVAGDGIATPRILGSHSFANEPVVGELCTAAERTVTVEMRDLRGMGGSYNLSIANKGQLAYNADGHTILTDSNAIDPFVSTSSVTIAPNGTAAFETGLSIDGSQFNGAAEFQWYVVAERTDGTETLSMPIFFRANPTVPAGGGDTSITQVVRNGSVEAGANAAGMSYFTDELVDVPAGTFRLNAVLDGDIATSESFPDYDLRLFDPNGNQIGTSGNAGSREFIDVSISEPGTYRYEIENYTGGPGSYTLTVDMHSLDTPAAPVVMDDIDIEFDADIDGNYTVSWTPIGTELRMVLQERVNAGQWYDIATLSSSQTSYSVTGAANGSYEYRMISHFAGQVCDYVTEPSNVVSVDVEHRELVSLDVDYSIVGGNFATSDFDMLFINNSGVELIEPITVTVIPGNGYAVQNGNVTNDTFAIDELIDGKEWSVDEATKSPITVDFEGAPNQLFTIAVTASGYRVE